MVQKIYGVYYGCLFLVLGLKNLILFTHIMREWVFTPEAVSDFVVFYSMGNMIFDLVIIGMGIFLLYMLSNKKKEQTSIE